MGLVSIFKATTKCRILAKKNHVNLGFGSTVNNNVFFGGNNKIGKFVTIRNTNIGIGTYISDYSNLSDACVGNYCSIGQYVSVISGRHPVDTYVSTHPAFYSTLGQAGFTFVEENTFNEYLYVRDKYSIIIGNDVWIGSHAKIMEGVCISTGAIIAAGAIVSKDVNPYEIVGGIPAKHIRYRFGEEIRNRLVASNWWDAPHETIKEHSAHMRDIDDFLSYLNDGLD